jgi:hypothetical protein
MGNEGNRRPRVVVVGGWWAAASPSCRRSASSAARSPSAAGGVVVTWTGSPVSSVSCTSRGGVTTRRLPPGRSLFMALSILGEYGRAR